MKHKNLYFAGYYFLFTLFLFFIIYFGFLPITFQSKAFRFFIVIIPLLLVLPWMVRFERVYPRGRLNFKRDLNIDQKKVRKLTPLFFIFVILVIIYLCLSIITLPIFGTKRYQSMIEVKENVEFTTSINEISKTKVPIVDKALAIRLGDKKLGEYKGMGSQFTVNNYTMIEANGELYWVGAIEYTGFFKWINNKDQGVPGYIKISATNPSQVELVEYPMFYVPSAYFGQDMFRKMYFKNPTKIFSDYTAFEIDNHGHPYFVKTVIKHKFAYTRGRDAVGVVILDAVTGEVNYYDQHEVPEWVDRIYPTDIIMDQLGYYGKYVRGYWNTLFSKREMMQVSEGYSYIYNDGQFYLYTGLTSVGRDESIVGFTLTNMRTKETTFYRIGGATEWSAQQSAEGAVQDLGYTATWPLLVNFQNIPTYFIPLKDREGLIKKYAYVNVRDYSLVGIGDTPLEAQNNYLKVLRQTPGNPNTGGERKELTGTITRKEEVLISGTSYYYLMIEGYDQLFIAPYDLSYELPLTKVGDTVTIGYYETSGKVFTLDFFNNHHYELD